MAFKQPAVTSAAEQKRDEHRAAGSSITCQRCGTWDPLGTGVRLRTAAGAVAVPCRGTELPSQCSSQQQAPVLSCDTPLLPPARLEIPVFLLLTLRLYPSAPPSFQPPSLFSSILPFLLTALSPVTLFLHPSAPPSLQPPSLCSPIPRSPPPVSSAPPSLQLLPHSSRFPGNAHLAPRSVPSLPLIFLLSLSSLS